MKQKKDKIFIYFLKNKSQCLRKNWEDHINFYTVQ